jgi:hypothetical protein
MDKYLKYQKIIQAFLKELADFGQYPSNTVETQRIEDNTNGHYLLYYNGWEGKRRTYGCLLHLELKKNARVYMHFNGTNLQIVDDLMEKGVEKSDIVLAFQPPYVREVSGFAVS